jgi:uncharacterized Zn finger protein
MRKECPECGNEMKVPSGGDGPVTVTCNDCGVVFDGVRHRKIAKI